MLEELTKTPEYKLCNESVKNDRPISKKRSLLNAHGPTCPLASSFLAPVKESRRAQCCFVYYIEKKI